ncbi:alanine racemase [Pseudonocardia sp. CNS-004]|nr:alanine racemase [Pseudonocardia sp. CNS-004]
MLRAAAPDAELMAVVKSDGYGHGLVPVASAAVDAGATWLGATTLAEALTLRDAGITARVLSWLHGPAEDFTEAVQAGIDLSVSSPAHLDAIVAGARRAGGRARLHLEVDTGLSRGGARLEEWVELLDAVERAVEEGTVEVVAVWSHLSHADDPRHPTLDLQAERLTEAWQAARERGMRPIRHLASSAAIMARPDLHFDLVRAGIALVGLDPFDRSPAESPFRPAMALRTRVVDVREVAAGAGVSYGHEWTAERDSVLARLAIGYGDAPFLGARGSRVLVGGEQRPVVGSASMDQLMVDLGPGNPTGVRAGDIAVVFGPGDHGEPTLHDLAELSPDADVVRIAGSVQGDRVRRTYSGDAASPSSAASHRAADELRNEMRTRGSRLRRRGCSGQWPGS